MQRGQKEGDVVTFMVPVRSTCKQDPSDSSDTRAEGVRLSGYEGMDDLFQF